MATRSTIAMEMDDGRVMQVYCHWDGYLDNNGKILLNHYDRSKTEELLSLGDISSLGTEVGEKHSFDLRFDAGDDRNAWTKFYGRDRGESDVGFRTFKDFDDYKNNHQYEEYEYILRKDGQWNVCCYGEKYQLLAEAIAEELIQKELAEDE